jgi:hypothetical protein
VTFFLNWPFRDFLSWACSHEWLYVGSQGVRERISDREGSLVGVKNMGCVLLRIWEKTDIDPPLEAKILKKCRKVSKMP